MTTTLQVACLVLAVPFLALGVAKLRAVEFMRERAEHVGFSVDAYRRIGAAEVAAGLALLLGGWVPLVALLALIGLAALLVGAVVVHARAGDPVVAVAPAFVLLLLVGGVGAGVALT